MMERLAEELLISTHNPCFCEEIRKISYENLLFSGAMCDEIDEGLNAN